MRNSYMDKAHEYEYPEVRYKLFDAEYLMGYSSGDTSFRYLTPGKYIMRIKPETVQKKTEFTIAWTASTNIELRHADVTQDVKRDILRDAAISVMNKELHFNFIKGQKTEMLCVAGTFESFGYGFVAAKASKSCPFSILIQIDPRYFDVELASWLRKATS